MAMIKRVTLTINKNNTSVKLSSPLKFYKNDSLLLQFEIEKWNFETKQNELVKPMYAVAFVETPSGTDMIECTILEGQIVQFQLLSRHTSDIGQGRLQIVVRDSHTEEESCQSATPPFVYEVEDLINTSQILVDENGNIIGTEEGRPLVDTENFNTVEELDELDLVAKDAYLFVTQDGNSYKAKVTALSNEIYVTVEQCAEMLNNYARVQHNHLISEVEGLQAALDGKHPLTALSKVATSGRYTDLLSTPKNVSAFVNDAEYVTNYQLMLLQEQVEELRKRLEELEGGE